MKYKILCALIIFICLNSCLYSQVTSIISEKSLSPEEKYSIQVWTTENGLPQNSINDISQTKNGYLWLATYDGLVQFDGVKFKVFNTLNTPELRTNGIRRLFTDSEDRLWIITTDGYLLSYFKNKFNFYLLPAKLSITSNIITDYQNGTILIAATNNKLYQFKNNTFQKYPIAISDKINSILSLNGNQLYIATDNGLYNFSNNSISELSEFKGRDVSQLYRSPLSDMIVYSKKEIYNVHGNYCKQINLSPFFQQMGEYKIAFDESKQLVILSDSGAFFLAGKELLQISMRSGLSSNSISSLFTDRENNLWIGTTNGGLNKLKTKVFKTLSKDNGMLDDATTAIIESHGSIYIGNNCGGISELRKDAFVNQLIQPEKKCIWSLMEDTQKNIWLGTYGAGIYIYDKGNIKRNYTQNNGLSSNVVFSIFQDSKKTIWIGTENGLTICTNNVFSQFDPTFHHAITYIYEDRNGDLWFCTNAGLATIKKNKITLLDKKNGFKKGAIRYVYEDADGTLWIGTHGNGLIRLKNGKAFYFTDHSNQLDKNVWSITEDDNGNLWLPSNAGMYIVNKKELNELADNNTGTLDPMYLSKEDGLKSIEFNGGFQPSMIKSNSGEFYFPTVKGVAIAEPSRLKKTKTSPQIVIETVSVNDKTITFNDSIILKPSDENLNILFTAPTFNNANKIHFQYKLEGINNKWINLGTAREIRLNYIPYDLHMLRIRTNKSSDETGILIYRPQQFWKRTQFIIIVAIIFVFMIFLITLGVINYIRKREMLKTQINKQYANIELKALQAQMNPHFIFNCLNSIQHFILVNDEVSASKYLTKFSMLIRKFLEHSKSNIVTLQEEIELLRLYMELESLRSKNKFTFHFRISPDIDIFNIEIPSMLFQPYVENAITHGLLNQEKKGILTLSFSVEDSYLIGIIEDNGIGRKRSAELKSDVYKVHTSRGMEITQERISVLNFIENIEITVDVIDKVNAENEPEGTKVIIKIPI